MFGFRFMYTFNGTKHSIIGATFEKKLLNGNLSTVSSCQNEMELKQYLFKLLLTEVFIHQPLGR